MTLALKKNELPKDWSNLSQDKKLDRLMEKLLTIDDINIKVNTIIKDRETQIGTDLLILKISSLEGKNQRFEKEVECLNSKIQDLQCRDMRFSIIFKRCQERTVRKLSLNF